MKTKSVMRKSSSRSNFRSTSRKVSSGKPTPKKSTPKRQVRATSLYIRSYNQFAPSKLVKHSKYVSRTECYVALYLSFFYSIIQQYAISGEKHVYDIYIPRFNLLIEYDGNRWHRNKKHDAEIDEIAKSHGYRIMRIKESDYMKNGRLKYVKYLFSQIDPTMATRSTSSYQKNLLKEFWKK